MAFPGMIPILGGSNRKSADAAYQIFCAAGILPWKEYPTMSRKPQRKVLSVCLAHRCYTRTANKLRTSFAGKFPPGQIDVVSYCQRNYV